MPPCTGGLAWVAALHFHPVQAAPHGQHFCYSKLGCVLGLRCAYRGHDAGCLLAPLPPAAEPTAVPAMPAAQDMERLALIRKKR